MEESFRRIIAEEIAKNNDYILPMLLSFLEGKKGKIPLPIKQIVELTNVSDSTLRAAKRDGKLQAYKFHNMNKVYFLLDDVLDLFYPED